MEIKETTSLVKLSEKLDDNVFYARVKQQNLFLRIKIKNMKSY